jgi:Tfp pilus assembly protein PilV
MLPPRVRQTQAEDGFVIIEVLVSALILAMVAGAVLALITATTHSAASERSHSVAYGLAQEAQARMRTMRLASLNGELPPETTKIGGTEYVIRSSGRFVNNKSGTRSCSSGEASADYVEITSTVSSATLMNPVSIHSVVAPSNGSLDPSHGTLAIQATNGEGKPMSGVTASISGPTSATASTGEEGCVVFADIPAPTSSTYRLTTSGNGLINREGKTEETLPSVSVPASGTQQISVYWDQSGAIAPQFVYAEPGTGTLQPAAIDSMMVYNSEGGKPASIYGTPGSVTPATPLEATPLFPFAATYAVYAGSCTKDLPEPSNSSAIGNVEVNPGPAARPQIQVPAVSALVTYGGREVLGATVAFTDTKCPETGTKVRRAYSTNQIGHAALSSSTSTQAIGLPWSTYKVCASARLRNTNNELEYRRAEATTSLSVETLTGPVTTTLSLSGTGSTGSKTTELKCP